MGCNKILKNNESLLVCKLVSLQDMNLMADFIKKFALKYGAKKNAVRKKKRP
jgi:hypothetical protein